MRAAFAPFRKAASSQASSCIASLAAHSYHLPPICTPRRAIAMRLWDKLHAYHRIWRYRLWSERRELDFMLGQPLAGAAVIDIGANRGVFSYWMHRCVGPNGAVVAFEPQPELATHLADFKLTFRLSRLTIVPAAVSDECGELTLVRPRTHWGGASFHLDSHPDGCDQLRVPVTTLDDFVLARNLPRVGFIKCDVQDHEAHVVRGAARLLQRDRPTLLIEQTDGRLLAGELSSLLDAMDYDGFVVAERGLRPLAQWPVARRESKAPYFNYLYRPRKTASTHLAA